MTSSANTPDLPGFVPNRDFKINGTQTARRGWRGITSLELAILGNNGIEKDFMDYLCSEPLVDGDLWRPARPLGRGGFGHVGLWHHKDQTGTVRDEMVIKEWPWARGMWDVPNQTGLAKEAVFQYQLNERDCENVPTLRQFKYVHDPQNPGGNKHRTYSEFCPYGDLDRLVMRYRAWSRYLPEPFLWHVFHSMANVAREMSRPPWVNYSNMKNFPADWSMIHFDIKPENVLLGRKRKRDEAEFAGPELHSVLRLNRVDHSTKVDLNDNFPPIKVHDFGLAEITGPDDYHNPIDFFWSGTPYFKPPEQRHYAIESPRVLNYKRRPYVSRIDSNGRLVDPYESAIYARGSDAGEYIPMDKVRNYAGMDPNDVKNDAIIESTDGAASAAGLKFGREANIWNVGKTMYDLMTLAYRGTFDEMMDVIDAAEDYDEDDGIDPEDFISKAEYVITNDSDEMYSEDLKAQVRESLRIRRDRVYSERLQNLMRECLHVRMSKRPGPERLFELTRQGLEDSRARAVDGEDAVPESLYYKDNEINDMPPGEHQFGYRLGYYNTLAKSSYWDVEWPRLRPPQSFLELARSMEGNEWQEPIPFRRPRTMVNNQWFNRPPSARTSSRIRRPAAMVVGGPGPPPPAPPPPPPGGQKEAGGTDEERVILDSADGVDEPTMREAHIGSRTGSHTGSHTGLPAISPTGAEAGTDEDLATDDGRQEDESSTSADSSSTSNDSNRPDVDHEAPDDGPWTDRSVAPADDTLTGDSLSRAGGSGPQTVGPDSDDNSGPPITAGGSQQAAPPIPPGGGQRAPDPRVDRAAYMLMTVAQLVAELRDRGVELDMAKRKNAYVDALMAADAAANYGNGALPTADRRRQRNR